VTLAMFRVTLMFFRLLYPNQLTIDVSLHLNRTEDGEMFVIKDPETFATQVIPQYFDHNKFSSFARQVRHDSITRPSVL
jgi:HSF-type DNA-binding